MVPPGGGQSMAELMTTYKHIIGSDKSQKVATAMGAGNIEKTLQQISHEL
jgi:type II secretory pathway component PulF